MSYFSQYHKPLVYYTPEDTGNKAANHFFFVGLEAFVSFKVCVWADLDGTTFVYDCRMRRLYRALLASSKDRTQRVILTF